jgi:glycosyltransferase involved in cell wall biosynthesis
MSLPLVSVVIPTYGRPEYLQRAVESVAQQEYDRLELVVVDDCSPTPAEQSLSELDLGDIEVTIVRHDENQGANVARNNGIRKSAGEYVAFLDDDDIWEPAKIRKQVEAFQTAPDDVGVVYTGSKYIYDDYENVETYDITGDVTRDILSGCSIGNFSTLLVDRAAIDAAGLPDPDLPSWQDRDWLLRLSEHCHFETVAEPLTVRWCQEGYDRINENFETKRDITYPRFLDKHRSLAATYGTVAERRFVASLSQSLGYNALKHGYYGDARRFLLKSLYYYPFVTERLLLTMVSLGGGYSYRPVRWLANVVRGPENA